jgi:putative transposase
MLLAHKIALNPNAAQRKYFAQASGVARFAYNWALGEWKRQAKEWWDSGKTTPFPSEAALRRQFNAIKREQFPWATEVSKCVVQEAIIDLGVAFHNYKSPTHKARYPQFKSKAKSAQSFCAANEVGTFRADGKRIKLPVIGWVRMREVVRFSGVCKRVTVSCVAGRWFASIMVDTSDVAPVVQPHFSVGVDLGVKTLATLSADKVIEEVVGPKAHTAALKRLRKANKSLARKKRGSKNFEKAKKRLARIHAGVANVRRDAHHKLTHRLVTLYQHIGIEDLNVRGMVANGRLARRVSDAAFGEFRRMLEYKAKLYGAQVVVANRFYASTKTCNHCGTVNPKVILGVDEWACGSCGAVHQRDHNAAINLENVAIAASSAVNACGEERNGAKRKPRVKRSSVKQEENTVLEEAA